MDETPTPSSGGQLVRFYDDGSVVAFSRDHRGGLSRRWLIEPAASSSEYRIPQVLLELAL